LTRRFLIIAALALTVRVWTVFTEPLPVSGDEIAHGNYVGHIHEFWSLPDSVAANEFLPPGQEGLAQMSYEFYQPPGYYVLAALLGGGKPLGTRLVSVLMFMVALCFVWAAARDTAIVLALSFIPGLIVTTSIIGNDVFLLLGSAIMFYACTQQKIWAFVLGGLVLATSKFHGVPILAVIGIYYLVKRERTGAIIALCFAVAGGLIVWWRWDLQDVNRESIALFTPTLLKISHVVGTTIATGTMHPVADSIGQIPTILGMVVGVVLILKAYGRIRSGLPVLHLSLVWAVFSFTHMWWHGRLLYAAIPWLCSAGGKSGIPGSPESRSAKPARGHRRRS